MICLHPQVLRVVLDEVFADVNRARWGGAG
jgi:hypothetical protein